MDDARNEQYRDQQLAKSSGNNRSAPVFTQLFSIAEKELPEDRFRQVLEIFTEGTMVA